MMSVGFTNCGTFFGGDNFKSFTAQDLTLLTDRASDMEKRQLAQSQKQRQDIIKKLKEIFAVAQAAQAEGLDKTDKYKKRLALTTDNLLKEEELYATSEKGTKAPDEVQKPEIDAYLAAHAKDFDEFVAMATEGMKEKPGQDLIDAQKAGWAEMRIRADRARKTGLDKSDSFKLQVRIQKAAMLNSLYNEKLLEKLKPTADEMKDFYSKNPDADPAKIKQTADDVLKRVKGGEDFAKLARDYSKDGSAEDGGLLKWFGKGAMVSEFEEAAYKMQKGQTSDQLVKTKFGYHIIKIEDRQNKKPEKDKGEMAKTDDAQDMILARHILFSTRDSDEAEGKVLQKKMQRATEDATLKYPVSAPEDFVVNIKGTSSNEAPSLQLPGSGGAPQGAPQGVPQGGAPQGAPKN